MSKVAQKSLFHNVETQNEWQDALDQDKSLIVADVHPEWCGPCTTFEFALEKLKNELLNDDSNPVAFYGVRRDFLNDNQVEKLGSKSCKPMLCYFSRKKLLKCTHGIDIHEIEKTIKSLILVHQEGADAVDGQLDGLNETANSKVADSTSESNTKLDKQREDERFIMLLKPDVVKAGKKEEILNKLSAAGVEILIAQERTMQRHEVESFYAHHRDAPFFPELVEFMLSGPICALLVSAPDASSLRALIGPADASQARQVAPDSFRAVFGTDQLRNGVHCSDSGDAAQREINLLFPGTVGGAQQSEMRSNGLVGSRGVLVVNVTKSILDDGGWLDCWDGEAITKLSGGIGATKILSTDELHILSSLKPYDSEENLVGGVTKEVVEKLSIVDTEMFACEIFGNSKEDLLEFMNNLGKSLTEKINLKKSALYTLDEENVGKILDELFGQDEKTLAMIKPEAFDMRSDLINKISQRGLRIKNIKEKTLTEKECRQIYCHNQEMPYFDELLTSLQSGPSIIMVLEGKKAVKRWREIMGPVDPVKAKSESPNSLRAFVGKSLLQNGLHGSSSVIEGNLESMLLADEQIA